MSSDRQTVHLVDDDDAIRRSVGFMLRTSGFAVENYTSGVDLLKEKELTPGCVLLDIRMPQMDGLEVQQALLDRGVVLPVIIMTGHGDISMAVQAMKAGAVEFIEKPFDKPVLLAAVHEGLARLDRADRTRARAEEAAVRLQILTSREKDVLHGLARGFPNKTIASDLGISPRTVEIHRANLMDKLEATSLSAALRIAFAAGLGEKGGTAA